MTLTSHPKTGTTIQAEEMAEHFEKILSMVDRVSEVFTLTTSGASLNATLSPGKAFISGYEVGEPGTDSDENLTFAANDTNHIFIDKNGVVTVNQTGTAPADSIKLFTATTNASGVTSETDVQDTDVEFTAGLVVQAVTSLGSFIGEDLLLSKSQPWIEFEDTGGDIFRIWNRNNKLQVTDQSGATVYVSNLADLISTLRKNVLGRLATPPGSPTTGDRYIVTATATGAWVGQEDSIAEWNGSSWVFTTPEEGYFLWVEDESRFYEFNGTSWAKQSLVDTAVGPTANTIALRNGTGNVRTAEPTSSDHAATKLFTENTAIAFAIALGG